MIYGLTGKKQSGKSTACSYIKTKLTARSLNFKDALVQEIKENFTDLLDEIVTTLNKTEYDGMNPWTRDRVISEKPALSRKLHQNYGTDVRRKDNPLYWVEKWKEQAAQINIGIVTDDVRFLNEAQAVKDLGGVIIKVERTDITHTDTHASETEMDEIVPDYSISVKTGEHQKLYDYLDFIIEQHEPTSGTNTRSQTSWGIPSTPTEI